MKKWLAMLTAVVLLLCALPLTVATVAAQEGDGNMFDFGDFDSNYGWGWDFYQSSTYGQGGALHGNNGAILQGYGGWGAMMEQTVTVTLGRAYHLEFWFKVVQNGFNWRLEQGGGTGLYETRWETATEWTHVSYDFVASSEWVTLNFCGSGNGIPEIAYVDDIMLTPIASSDYDGYLSNGNFESDPYTGWYYHDPSSCSPEAALSGSYGAHLVGDGDWDSMMEQTFYTQAGVEYAVIFFYKVNQNGFHAQVLGSSSCYNLLAEGWCEETEWSMGMLSFVADGEYAIVNFSGAGNGTPEDAYIDEVYVFSEADVTGEQDLADEDQTNWKTYGYVTYCDSAASFEDGMGIHARGYGGGAPILERTFATEEGAGYNLSFLYQNLKEEVGFTFVIEDGVTHEELYSSVYGGTGWGQEEVLFTATSGTTVIRFAGDGGDDMVGLNREEFYVDEMYLTSYAEETTPVQEVKNGSFENGQVVGWSVYQGTALTPYAASEGAQGILLQGTGGWGGLLEQGFFTEPGAVYQLTFSYKVLSNGFNVQILNGSDGFRLGGGWYTADQWTEETIVFTAQTATTRLNFCGGGNGFPESAYLDNVVLTRLDEGEGDDPEIPDLPDLPDIVYDEIVAGEITEVTVPEELGMAFFTFTPAASGWYTFTSYGDDNTYILIADEDGENGIFNDNDADGHNFRAVYYCEADTLYVLMATTAAFSGSFDMMVEAVDEDALFPAATPIRYGDTTAVELEQAGISQIFSFVPTADGTYILTAEGDEDTYCFLYDVSGGTVTLFDDEFTDEDNYNFVATYDCEAGNSYYFVVSTYAEESASSFTVSLTAEEEPSSPEVVYGDANGDGAVNNRDLALMQQHINKWEVQIDLTAADVNADGAVNNRDLALLQQYINKWDVTLGEPNGGQ